MGELFIIDHPLIVHKLSIMRDKSTGTKDFKELLNEISMLMAYEITRDLPLEDKEIETPICKMTAKKISGKKLAVVPFCARGSAWWMALPSWYLWQRSDISVCTATRSAMNRSSITAKCLRISTRESSLS